MREYTAARVLWKQYFKVLDIGLINNIREISFLLLSCYTFAIFPYILLWTYIKNSRVVNKQTPEASTVVAAVS